MVVELKISKDEGKIEKAAKEALEQVSEKGYKARYERMGCEVISMGIAYHGKRVRVVCKT